MPRSNFKTLKLFDISSNMGEFIELTAKENISYRTHLGDDMFELGLAERVPENTNPYDD